MAMASSFNWDINDLGPGVRALGVYGEVGVLRSCAARLFLSGEWNIFCY